MFVMFVTFVTLLRSHLKFKLLKCFILFTFLVHYFFLFDPFIVAG